MLRQRIYQIKVSYLGIRMQYKKNITVYEVIVKDLSNKMAFYGKKWKKSHYENFIELMDKLNIPEKTRAILGEADSVVSLLKHDDGSIQYVVTLGDKDFSETIVLGEERDCQTPDGVDAKITYKLEGDTLKSVLVFQDGHKLHLNRTFSADKMVLQIYMEGVDLKANVTYLPV